MPFLTMILMLLMPLVASSQQLAFPTAEGFGRFTVGGRGNGSTGYVCHVTSTATTVTGSVLGGLHKAGTLPYCLDQTGPRTIVFDISGTINFADTRLLLNDNNPNVTIAAQTAPGDGIMLRETWFTIAVDQVIIRHLRLRSGVVDPTLAHSWQGIGIGVADGSVNDAIFDHISNAWVPDDSISMYHMKNLTVQWSILAEGMVIPQSSGGNSKGGGSWGVGANGGTSQNGASILHNLYAHLKDRAPFSTAGDLQFVNNMVYNVNPGSNILPIHGPIDIEFISNYYLTGPNSASNNEINLYAHDFNQTEPLANTALSRIYLSGNYHNISRPNSTFAETSLVNEPRGAFPKTTAPSPSPLGFPTLASLETNTAQVRTDVLAKAGATVPIRDAVDTRIIGTVNSGTGNCCNSSPPSPGYPAPGTTSRNLATYDEDFDGIPNAWEDLCNSSFSGSTTGGLSKTVGTDGNDILDWSSPTGGQAALEGYSKLEIYLNEVAGDYALNTCGGLLTGEDTTAPTGVAITAPSNGATVSGASVTFSADATDETAMDRVEFYQNDTLIGTDTSSPYSITWDTTGITDGDKTLKVIAYDTSENSTISSTITATVDNVSAYTATHRAASVTVDGNLTEFSGANIISLGPSNETDCRLMWSSTNFYIGCITNDTLIETIQTSHDASSMFNDDAIEMVIDTDNDGVYDSTDYKFMVNANEVTWDASGAGFTLSYEPGYSAQVALVGTLNNASTDTSWSLEMAIPWSELGITAAADNVYGINIQVDDRDNGVRTAYRWNGSINNISDAMDVVLGPESGGGDTDPPVDIAITNLTDGQYIRGNHTIQATAQDAVGVKDIEFFEGANTICTDTTSPFSCGWDTTQETDGAYTLSVTACDTADPENCDDSASIGVNVDNTIPTSPSNLTLIPTVDSSDLFAMSIDWDASTDASGIVTYGVERCRGIGCNNFVEISMSSVSSEFDTLLFESSTYCYRIRAYDAAGNPSSGYSNTACARTLTLFESLPFSTSLLDTADNTISFPAEIASMSDTAGNTVGMPPSVTGLNDTADDTVSFPPPATGLQSQ